MATMQCMDGMAGRQISRGRMSHVARAQSDIPQPEQMQTVPPARMRLVQMRRLMYDFPGGIYTPFEFLTFDNERSSGFAVGTHVSLEPSECFDAITQLEHWEASSPYIWQLHFQPDPRFFKCVLLYQYETWLPLELPFVAEVEYDMEDRAIKWQSVDGFANAGEVHVRESDDGFSDVEVSMEYLIPLELDAFIGLEQVSAHIEDAAFDVLGSLSRSIEGEDGTDEPPENGGVNGSEHPWPTAKRAS